MSWSAARQTAADLQVDRSAIAILCRRSLTWDGLATAWIDPTRLGEGRWIAQAGTGRTTLLNVLERQLSAPANYRSGISALLTSKLLQDMVEVVAAEDGHVGLVGANGGGSDMP